MNYEDRIGFNIRKARLEKGLSQQKLAEKCGFSNTTLSSYETGNKKPSLTTIAEIAKQLGVSIERLYYGDENNAFLYSAPDEGRKIVNSIYYLWSQGVIWYNDRSSSGGNIDNNTWSSSYSLLISKHLSAIARLIKSLNEFRMNRETFEDPDGYLEMILSSVAAEINREIETNKQNAVDNKTSSKKAIGHKSKVIN